MVPTNSSPTSMAQTVIPGSPSAFAQCESNASLVRGIVTAMRFDSGSSLVAGHTCGASHLAEPDAAEYFHGWSRQYLIDGAEGEVRGFVKKRHHDSLLRRPNPHIVILANLDMNDIRA